VRSWMVCCTIVTVRLHPRLILARQVDRNLTLWLGTLAALTALNIGLWIWIARSASPRTSYGRPSLMAWEVWREEVPWMTLYFSIGVWTSLAMVLL